MLVFAGNRRKPACPYEKKKLSHSIKNKLLIYSTAPQHITKITS